MLAKPAAPSPELVPKARRVHDRLCAEYGCLIAYSHALDPLSGLAAAMNRDEAGEENGARELAKAA